MFELVRDNITTNNSFTDKSFTDRCCFLIMVFDSEILIIKMLKVQSKIFKLMDVFNYKSLINSSFYLVSVTYTVCSFIDNAHVMFG